jgi:hypothetical protein
MLAMLTGWSKAEIEDMPLEEFFDALDDALAFKKKTLGISC